MRKAVVAVIVFLLSSGTDSRSFQFVDVFWKGQVCSDDTQQPMDMMLIYMKIHVKRRLKPWTEIKSIHGSDKHFSKSEWAQTGCVFYSTSCTEGCWRLSDAAFCLLLLPPALICFPDKEQFKYIIYFYLYSWYYYKYICYHKITFDNNYPMMPYLPYLIHTFWRAY